MAEAQEALADVLAGSQEDYINTFKFFPRQDDRSVEEAMKQWEKLAEFLESKYGVSEEEYHEMLPKVDHLKTCEQQLGNIFFDMTGDIPDFIKNEYGRSGMHVKWFVHQIKKTTKKFEEYMPQESAVEILKKFFEDIDTKTVLSSFIHEYPSHEVEVWEENLIRIFGERVNNIYIPPESDEKLESIFGNANSIEILIALLVLDISISISKKIF